MFRFCLRALSALAAFALLLIPLTALAHESVPVGDYEVEYGWVNEPSVVGQPNAFVININQGGSAVEADVSQLKIDVVYGPESKTLTLQPLGEDTPGQFIAPITPTRAGQYTLRLSGKIDTTDVNVEVTPEEVATADAVQFPSIASAASAEAPAASTAFGLTGWLAVGGLLTGLLGLGIGLAAFMRKN